MAATWYYVSPVPRWHHLVQNSTITGVILENSLVLLAAAPVPLVLILMILTALKARQHLSTIASDEDMPTVLASQQIEGDLKLLQAFGVVYILGFGLMFVVNVNQLLNLSGAVNVVPYWQDDLTFCVYYNCIDQICNMVINFANSSIIVRTRNVQGALKRMYRASSRAVRHITRRENREILLTEEDQAQSV